MNTEDRAVTIRSFTDADQTAFRQLNEEWINRYFALEPSDESALADPRGSILNQGGKIFLAWQDRQPVGCCALLAQAPSEFELAKMAVTEACQGAGIGRLLLEKAIAEARALGATRLTLGTNRMLEPAIHLYEAFGFRHIPPERLVPSPYARANVHMELTL